MRPGAAPILWRTLRDLRWHIAGYGIGLGIYAAMLVLIFPAFEEVLADLELPAAYEALYGDAASDLTRPSNFFSLEFFSWAPLILSIYAAVVSTAAPAAAGGWSRAWASGGGGSARWRARGGTAPGTTAGSPRASSRSSEARGRTCGC